MVNFSIQYFPLNAAVFFIGLIVVILFLVSRSSSEHFLFCNPSDCKCVCNRNEYKGYCENPYSKGGPQALCKCSWSEASRKCEGTRATDTTQCRI